MKSVLLVDHLSDFLSSSERAGSILPGTGLAASVVENGLELKYTSGFRARDSRLPVTSDTVFEICSLTKAFTSMAALTAAREGTIDLDHPINGKAERLILSDPDVSSRVSVRDVLSHRVGLPSNDLLWYLGRKSANDLSAAVRNLELIPGAFRRDFGYNNLLYGLLGQLFPSLVGESWEGYTTARLLSPLGMRSTTFRPPEHEEDVALPYQGFQRVARVDMSSVSAAGALRSTLNDMSRWLSFLLSDAGRLHDDAFQPILPAENVNPLVLQGLEWLGTERPLSYGLGWFIGTYQGLRVPFHPGLVDGFSCAIALVPEKRLGIVVMMNVGLSAAPGQLIKRLLDLALVEKPEAPTLKASGPAPEAIVGSYANSAYGRIYVELAEDGHLVLRYGGNVIPIRWNAPTEGELQVDAFGLRIPLPMLIESDGPVVARIQIPLTLDPRLSPQAFHRLP